MRAFRLLPILALIPLLQGCSVSLNITKQPSGSEADFLNSKISSNSSALADGKASVTVKLTFINSDGSMVEGFLPEYEITSGAGVLTEKCTLSDAQGSSVCELRATQSGIKKFKIINLPEGVRLERDVSFFALGLTPTLAAADASTVQSSGGSGYKMQSSAGQTMGDQQATAPGGWKMTGSAQMTGAIQ